MDGEMGRRGDGETRRRGDEEGRRRGEWIVPLKKLSGGAFGIGVFYHVSQNEREKAKMCGWRRRGVDCVDTGSESEVCW